MIMKRHLSTEKWSTYTIILLSNDLFKYWRNADVTENCFPVLYSMIYN